MEFDDLVLLVGDDNTYLRERGTRVELHEGVLSEEATAAEYGSTVETHVGEEFRLVKPDLEEVFRHRLEQRTQTPPQEDLGYVVARTGVGSESRVADAGTGSAFTALTLANVVNEVDSYEVREEFVETARDNVEAAGADNVSVHHRDVKEEGFTVEDVDLVFLDMMHLEEAVEPAAEAVRSGGYVVCYCPVFEQVRDCHDSFEEYELEHSETVEIGRREWSSYPARPEHDTVPHTAFIAFARKMG